MDCKAHEEGLAWLSRGGDAPEASRHVASCPACAERLERLRRIVAAARLRYEEAPDELAARAAALFPPKRRRLVARLLGNGLATSGARREAADFSLHVGTPELPVYLYYAPTKRGWEILGSSPEGEWTTAYRGEETPCGPLGHFKLDVPSLQESSFALRSSDLEIEIPSAGELTDRGL